MEEASRPVALVTGGSRGIGAGICRALAASGYDLVVNGRRPVTDVTDVVEEFESLGAGVLYVAADIGSREDRAAMLDSVRERFGRLDVLVNNAGITSPGRDDLLEAKEESFDLVINTNLRGPYFLTQEVAGWMIEQGKEHPDRRFCVQFVTSVSSVMVSVNRGDYCMAKAALSMAVQLWAARLAEFRIDVYEIRPGIIETDMTSGVRGKYDRLIEEGLLIEPRWGTPEDVGRAARALAEGAIPYATGQVLTVDGGLTSQRL